MGPYGQERGALTKAAGARKLVGCIVRRLGIGKSNLKLCNVTFFEIIHVFYEILKLAFRIVFDLEFGDLN